MLNKNISKSQLEKLYLDPSLLVKDICVKLNTNRITLNKALAKFGIPQRGKGNYDRGGATFKH